MLNLLQTNSFGSIGKVADKGKPIITGAIILGDSLSDEGKKYNEDVCGCFPFKWFLDQSKYNNFTNGHTWSYMFKDILNEQAKKNSDWLMRQKLRFNDFKNVAEGGSTAYNYRNVTSFFKYFKGFILSFFLGNTQEQARKLKANKNILRPNKLGIIFAGANDLVTLNYHDEQGVKRAVQGIDKTLETLTESSEKIGLNYLKHMMLIGVPDISETPRYARKSIEEKTTIKKACQAYNQKLQELANEYQYVNFDLCTIYKFTNINYLQNIVKEIKNGIVVTGEGKNRKVIFINNGEFICDKHGKQLIIDISLSKKQLEIFSQKDGQVKRNVLNGFISKVTRKAKLNVDIKILDIEATLDEILRNPEVHGFTAGCAVYFLPKEGDKESDERLISQKVTSGNAVIIKETDTGFFSYIIKEGLLVKEQAEVVKIKFELSVVDQSRLRKKLKQPPSSKEIIKLVGMEDIHDICIIDVIKSIVESFKRSFHKEMVLTAITNSVLESIKKEFLNRDYLFWDDLHPARRLHELLAIKINEFIESKYLIQYPLQFRDDSVIGVRPKLRSDRFNEAPASLPSEPSLLIKVDNIESTRVESKVAYRHKY